MLPKLFNLTLSVSDLFRGFRVAAFALLYVKCLTFQLMNVFHFCTFSFFLIVITFSLFFHLVSHLTFVAVTFTRVHFRQLRLNATKKRDIDCDVSMKRRNIDRNEVEGRKKLQQLTA